MLKKTHIFKSVFKILQYHFNTTSDKLLSEESVNNLSEELLDVMAKQKTWISSNMINLAHKKSRENEILNILLENAYRMTHESFILILSKNIVPLSMIKKLLLKKVLWPSLLWDGKIDDIDFLQNIFKILGLDSIYQSKDDRYIIWEIILSQYFYRITIPLLQLGLPPYIIISIMDQMPFIEYVPHRIKAKYVVGIFKSRLRILHQLKI